MNIIRRDYEHYANIATTINIYNRQQYNMFIVYFVNCFMNPNYYDWVIQQLTLIKYVSAIDVYVVATIAKEDEDEFTVKVSTLLPKVNISFYPENEHEYRGILKVWELGQLHSSTNDIILYFHSKGVTRNNSYEENKNDAYNVILHDTKRVEEIFDIFPKVSKVGYCTSGEGFMWYNFWYARGSYVHTVQNPIKTSDRYYYEVWLGLCADQTTNNRKYDKESCYGFYTDKVNIANIGSIFLPHGGFVNEV